MNNVDSHPQSILSLCAGVGGLDLSLRLALPASQTICYVENEAYCCEVLASRMEEGFLAQAPIWTDLKTFDGRAWRGKVDIVTAGYPCQGFSVAGRRLGAADPRHLWPEVARVISECEPRIVFLENVSNHLRLGFRSVAEDLRRMGYKVAATLLRAEEVGASHRRERLFILGVSKSYDKRGLWSSQERRQIEARGSGSSLAHSQSLDRQGGSATRAVTSGLAGSEHSVAHTPQQRERESHDASRAKPREDSWSDAGGRSSSVADSEHPQRGPLSLSSDNSIQGLDTRRQEDGGVGVSDTLLANTERHPPARGRG